MKKLLSILLLIVSFNAVAGPSDSALYQKQWLKWRMKVPFWMDNGMYLQRISLQATGDSILVAKASNGLVGYRSISTILGNYVPYTGASTNVNIGTNTYIGHSLKSDASDGVLIEAANGTDVGIFGAGNTANSSLYGGLTIGSLTSGNGTDSVVVASSTGLLKKRPASAFGTTYSAGRGLTLGGTTFRLDTSKQYRLTNGLLFGSTGAGVTGLTGSSQFNDITLSNWATVGASSYFQWNGRSAMRSSADGTINLSNQANDNFTLLTLGPGTSSFPSLLRSGNKVISRLADNSGNTNLQVKDTVYSSIWNGQIDVPTKNAVYDKIEALSSLYTYSAGNGIILGSNTFFSDSSKRASLYGNSWQNGMYLGSSNNRSIVWRTNALQRMTLDSNGRLAINSRTPLYQFEFNQSNTSISNLAQAIGKTAYFGHNNRAGGLLIGVSGGGTGFIQNVDGTNAYVFNIQPYGGELIVGSTSGSNFSNGLFNVNGSSNLQGLVKIWSAPSASANTGSLSLSNTTTAFNGSTAGYFVGAATGTYVAVNSVGSVAYNFLDFQKNGTSRFRLDSLGNIFGKYSMSTPFYTASDGALKAQRLENVDNNSSISILGSSGISSTNASIYFQGPSPTTYTNTSGTRYEVELDGTFSPTSGTAVHTAFYIPITINQTGGANGITRGLYINPTLTAAADFRGIETNIASGTGRYAYYGAGTALALFGGNINFNGTAATDVMLRRNGTKVSARLGDNSADANVTVKDSVYDATAWDANNSVPTKNAVRDKIEAMNVTDGTWTPTLTNAGNVSATTARVCYYMRIGTRVMCWGTFAITPTVISTSTTVRMTLPISSTFTTIYQAGGSGIGAGTVNDQYTVNSSTSNPEVFFTTASSTNITSEEISFNFGYTIF